MSVNPLFCSGPSAPIARVNCGFCQKLCAAVVYLLAQWARKDMAQMQRQLDEKQRAQEVAAGMAAAGGGSAELEERLSAVEETIQALLRSQAGRRQAAEAERTPGLGAEQAAQAPPAAPKADDAEQRPK